MAAVLAMAAGCATRPVTPQISGYLVKELGHRQVFSKGRLIGYLRELEIQQPSAPVRYFRVETPSGGWAGNVDGYGRFYKCEPFREQPTDIGMYSMAEGLGRLFEIETPIRIVASTQTGGAAVDATGRDRRRDDFRHRDTSRGLD